MLLLLLLVVVVVVVVLGESDRVVARERAVIQAGRMACRRFWKMDVINGYSHWDLWSPLACRFTSLDTVCDSGKAEASQL